LYVIQLELRRTRRRRSFSFRRRRSLGRGRRDFTTDERAFLLARYDGRCRYCGEDVHYRAECEWEDGCPLDYEADHAIPYSRGGPTTLENGRAACRYHNRMKGDMTEDEFISAGGRR
jgi:5-methylcytosine-specific restriction endonuclease McrA